MATTRSSSQQLEQKILHYLTQQKKPQILTDSRQSALKSAKRWGYNFAIDQASEIETLEKVYGNEVPTAYQQLIAESEARAQKYADELMAQHTTEVTVHGYVIYSMTIVGLISLSALLAWFL